MWLCTDASIVWCHYNVIQFFQNPHSRHSIAHPLGRGMGCPLWVQTLFYIPPQSLCLRLKYHAIPVGIIRHSTVFICLIYRLNWDQDLRVVLTCTDRHTSLSSLHTFWHPTGVRPSATVMVSRIWHTLSYEIQSCAEITVSNITWCIYRVLW